MAEDVSRTRSSPLPSDAQVATLPTVQPLSVENPISREVPALGNINQPPNRNTGGRLSKLEKRKRKRQQRKAHELAASSGNTRDVVTSLQSNEETNNSRMPFFAAQPFVVTDTQSGVPVTGEASSIAPHSTSVKPLGSTGSPHQTDQEKSIPEPGFRTEMVCSI